MNDFSESSLTADEQALLLKARSEPDRGGYLAPPEVSRQIARAEECIRSGRKDEARTVLQQAYLYAVKNPQYWWAVARAAKSRKEAVGALAHVLHLRPHDEQALALLRRLDRRAAEAFVAEEAPPPERIPLKRRLVWLVRMFVFALVAALVVLVVIGLAGAAGLGF